MSACGFAAKVQYSALKNPRGAREEFQLQPAGQAGADGACLAACAMGLAGMVLSSGGASAGAAEATALQDGTGGAVHVEQDSTTATARITQRGSGNATQAQQSGAIGSSLTVDQAGAANRLDVWQLQGSLDASRPCRAGTLNTARLLQSGGTASAPKLLVLREAGSAGLGGRAADRGGRHSGLFLPVRPEQR